MSDCKRQYLEPVPKPVILTGSLCNGFFISRSKMFSVRPLKCNRHTRKTNKIGGSRHSSDRRLPLLSGGKKAREASEIEDSTHFALRLLKNEKNDTKFQEFLSKSLTFFPNFIIF
jgi:hypothetical protein